MFRISQRPHGEKLGGCVAKFPPFRNTHNWGGNLAAQLLITTRMSKISVAARNLRERRVCHTVRDVASGGFLQSKNVPFGPSMFQELYRRRCTWEGCSKNASVYTACFDDPRLLGFGNLCSEHASVQVEQY